MNFKFSLAGALTVVMAITLVAVVSDRASAQLPGLPGGIGVGAYVPTSSWAKQGGDTQVAVDLRYNFPGAPLTPTKTVMELSYEGGNGTGHSTIVPLTIGETFGNGTIPGLPYFGLGAGAYYIDQSGSSVTTRLGGYASLGYRFTLLFAELKYQYADKAEGWLGTVGLSF